MTTAYQNPTEQSATSLVTGIIDDFQELVKQQFRLARQEAERDLRNATEGALFFAVSAGILFLGAIIFCFAVVHLLHWAGSPPDTDPSRFPLWACHGVVGLVLLIVGGVLAGVGRMKFKSIRPLDNPATEALKENVEWATNQK